MVKVQRRFAYRYKNKDHYKHILNIPEDVIEILGWKEGQDVEPSTENGKLILEPKK
jgi:hypothetical protein